MPNRWGIPPEVEATVLARDQVCVYCAAPFGVERRTNPSWEHIVNDIRLCNSENIALCCVGCNASKGAKVLQAWLESDNARRRGVTLDTLSPVVLAALSRLKE
jgi:hypothetical protein